jgi:TRAP-type mannitol/chloroaromatic compound transport system permease small subunit
MNEQQASGSDQPLSAIHDPGEIGRADHNKTDRIVVQISNLAAWIFPVLIMAICIQVVIRQLGHNQAWLDDLQWWLYGTAGLLGTAYAVTTDSHVRVDVLYEGFSAEKKTRSDVFGLVWCILPFILLCWDVTFSYAMTSWSIDEGSSSPNGLHNLWILKTILNLSFVLIAFAIVGIYVRKMRLNGETRLGRLLLWAFPSLFFAINLAFYHVLYGYHYLTLKEGQNPRTIRREAVFGELELFGIWDIRYTIIAALFVTIAVIGAALLRDARRSK